MRRKPTSPLRSPAPRLVRWLFLLLLAAVLWLLFDFLFDCLFQNALSAHGTLLFLPDG